MSKTHSRLNSALTSLRCRRSVAPRLPKRLLVGFGLILFGSEIHHIHRQDLAPWTQSELLCRRRRQMRLWHRRQQRNSLHMLHNSQRFQSLLHMDLFLTAVLPRHSLLRVRPNTRLIASNISTRSMSCSRCVSTGLRLVVPGLINGKLVQCVQHLTRHCSGTSVNDHGAPIGRRWTRRRLYHSSACSYCCELTWNSLRVFHSRGPRRLCYRLLLMHTQVHQQGIGSINWSSRRRGIRRRVPSRGSRTQRWWRLHCAKLCYFWRRMGSSTVGPECHGDIRLVRYGESQGYVPISPLSSR